MDTTVTAAPATRLAPQADPAGAYDLAQATIARASDTSRTVQKDRQGNNGQDNNGQDNGQGNTPGSPAPQADQVKHYSVTISPGMSAEQYVKESVTMHYGRQHQGFVNGGLLQFSRKVGDMALAVIPKNRFWCAVGLTSGGFAGLKFAGLLAGQRLTDNKPSVKEDYHKLLQPLHGVLKYDPHSSAIPDRWKKVGALFTFTAVSFAGIMSGAYYAYRSSRKKNEHPHSLEDFAARAGQHQGDKWRWLAASSGVFGSASGYFVAPIPGVSYGPSIAFYTVLNQDRKIMTPGFKGLSGTKTMSYLGLREGMDYICKYAVNNPARDPAELEFLALTVLGPVGNAMNKQIDAECIKHFVDKVHEVRDQYWQEGGIPPEKRAAALKDMYAHFKGKGLDRTLYECGLDTMKLDFTKLNGFIGKVGNSLGADDAIRADQAAYRAMATQWRKEWMPATPAPADSALEAQGQAPAKLFAREELKKSVTIPPARSGSYVDNVTCNTNSDVLATSL